MNVRKALPIIAIISIGAWWFLRRQSTRVQLGAVSTRVHSINFQGIKLVVTLPIINGSNITSTVQGFIGQLYHRANPIGTITMPRSPIKIVPFQQTALEFEVQIGLLSGLQSLAPDLYAIIATPPKNVNDALALIDLKSMRIKGNLLIDGINVDIDQTLA